MEEVRASLSARGRLAEHLHRYDLMWDAVEKLISTSSNVWEPSYEHRRCFDVAVHGVINETMDSLAIIAIKIQRDEFHHMAKGILQKASVGGEPSSIGVESLEAQWTRAYSNEKKRALVSFIERVVSVIKQMKSSSSASVQSFYWRIEGDCYRAIKELDYETKTAVIDLAFKAYKCAVDLCQNLESTDPIRLEASLSLAKFYFDVLNEPRLAHDCAHHAFDAAMANLVHRKSDRSQESNSLLQSLKDNLLLWDIAFNESL